MPGLKKVLKPHQTLNSSNISEVSRGERWNWSRFRQKRKVLNRSNSIVNSEVLQDPAPQSSPSHALTDSRTGSVDTISSTLESIVNEDQVCLLCLSVPQAWFSITCCGCKFCLSCMQMYAHCCIQNGQVPIVCPDGNCPQNSLKTNHLTQNEVKYLVPNDAFPLFLTLLLNREVAINPDLMWCPRPGCETVCSVIQGEKKKSKKKLFGFITLARRHRNSDHRIKSVTCGSCDFRFCAQCKTPWHDKKACPTLAKTNGFTDRKIGENDDPVALLELQGFVKRCPFCQVPIERDEGCAQMMCKNCRHVFCWFCLASLDDDFMLRHYDSGPCRSRLGHSRVSVVWHRAQVVSAFLGLGILFLATSPLILLASPCLLCCLRHHFHSNLSNASTPENNHES